MIRGAAPTAEEGTVWLQPPPATTVGGGGCKRCGLCSCLGGSSRGTSDHRQTGGGDDSESSAGCLGLAVVGVLRIYGRRQGGCEHRGYSCWGGRGVPPTQR